MEPGSLPEEGPLPRLHLGRRRSPWSPAPPLERAEKIRKSYIASLLTLWWAFVTPRTEIILAANDLEQSQSRIFKTCLALIQFNPSLASSVSSRASDI